MSSRRLLLAGLALFLLGFGFYVLETYICRVVSDPSTYLDFGESLAQGRYYIDYPPNRVFQEYFPPQAVLKATHTNLYSGGRTFSFADIGYPLYLALFFRLGGKYGPFFANALAFLGIFALLFAVSRRLFEAHPQRLQIAVLAPVLYFLANRERLTQLLVSYNDPLSYLLLLLSVLFLLRHLAGRRDLDIAVAGLCLGLAITVRKTSFVAALPLFVLWARDAIARRGSVRWRTVPITAAAVLVGMAPILAQNWVNTGSPLYSTHVLYGRVTRGEVENIDDDKPTAWVGFGPEFVASSLRRHLGNVGRPLGWGLTAALALGIWFGRATPGVLWLLLPFAGSFLLFHSLFRITPWRYVFVVQVALAPLLALGIVECAARIGARLHARFLANAAAAAVLAVGLVVLVSPSKAARFQVPQAEAFRKDFERALPAGALVIAERPMRRIIDYFTHAYSVKPDDFVRPQAGLTLRAGLEYYRRTLGGVYFFDAADGIVTDAYDNTPVTREQLLAWYDLTPVATFAADAYHLDVEFGKPTATLYRLDEWTAKEVSAELAPPAAGDLVLRLNGRDHPPLPADVRWGERPIDGSLAGGLRWYLLPGSTPAAPPGVLRVSAAAPLPRDLAPTLFGLDAPLVLDTGPEAIPLADLYLSPEFTPARRAGWSILAGAGRVQVPVFPVPGSTVVLTTSVRVRKEQGAAPGGRFRLAGGGTTAEFELHGSNWSTVSLPLERPDPGRNTAEVTIGLLPGGEASGGEPEFQVASCTVSRLRHRDAPAPIEFGKQDEAFLVEGFYYRERGSGSDTFRWTDGEGRLRIPGPPDAPLKAYRLTLRAAGPPPAVAGRTLRLTLNGVALGEAPLGPEGMRELAFEVPRGGLRPGVNELVIASTPWVPKELLGTHDDRRLGVRVESLRLSAEPTAPAPADPRPPGGPLPGGGA